MERVWKGCRFGIEVLLSCLIVSFGSSIELWIFIAGVLVEVGLHRQMVRLTTKRGLFVEINGKELPSEIPDRIYCLY